MKYRLDPTVLDMARTELNLDTDRALADHLGISCVTVSAYRQGKTVPSVRTLLALRQATGRPLDTMMMVDKAPAESAA